MENILLHRGKVRDVYSLGDDYLAMVATNRVSAFDRHIGEISNKGTLLNKMSEFWFNNTRHIIDNHLISTNENTSLVHRCKPIQLEIIVRGYITGNTKTSLWTHYNSGSRNYCGIHFPDGLKKNQKLEHPVVTPTTKGEIDVPISKQDIIDKHYLTQEECDYVYDTALKLYNFGTKIANEAGYILVDTKYEFGFNKNGNIILMDEVHTCDSSRYWLKKTYNENYEKELEPDKLDKDCLRDWIKKNCDPYSQEIPPIPNDIIDRVENCYKTFYNNLRNINTVNKDHLVVILSGSKSDKNHVDGIKSMLEKHNIEYCDYVASAHKETEKVLSILSEYKYDNRNIVWVTVAGRSNALSGVVACNCNDPVIACPPFADKMDMFTNVNSSLQCPSNVPVMTILDKTNVALSIKRILRL